jgi:hypothetical protein
LSRLDTEFGTISRGCRSIRRRSGGGCGRGGRVWVMVRLWRQGRPARLGPWTAILHSHSPPPSPSPPSPSPFLTPNHPSPSPFPPAWHGDGRALLLCRRLARPDPGQYAGRPAAVHAGGTTKNAEHKIENYRSNSTWKFIFSLEKLRTHHLS